jgi:hypothetical protein
MSSRPPEWERIFEALDIIWCRRCALGDDLHRRGSYAKTGIFHWTNRRMTRPGIHKALRRIAESQNEYTAALPEWRRIYLINQAILDLARRAHLRQPRYVFDLDRARLRYLLAEYGDRCGHHGGVPRERMNQDERQDFKEARRWAARS